MVDYSKWDDLDTDSGSDEDAAGGGSGNRHPSSSLPPVSMPVLSLPAGADLVSALLGQLGVALQEHVSCLIIFWCFIEYLDYVLMK